ncbi:hypothetical protein TSOC_003780 [Tetrabaena socialis]|uniref:Uncharacterized protein n=1 Tax=Tetrabaena socialis TaxID=47790 RepID=A0A2J8AAI1_9CHLO|nr:hypothetical protein TSOC_003780 [Tetrabaena socialis]|eukprot:PNH09540.1 hypothetical protein TSOC_003780 [Tetrabaena socialis]
MALVTSSAYSPSAYTGSPIDLRNHGALVHTAEMQYQRQLKTLQALHKQAELTVEDHVTWQERERQREEKYRQIEQERQVQHEERVEHGQRVRTVLHVRPRRGWGRRGTGRRGTGQEP